jgi:O-antigen/teichoic acid export membrane protein
MKAVLQNLASVLGGEAAVRVANFAAVLFIARAYDGRVFGVYAVILAIVTAVVMFADNGLQTLAITQLSGASLAHNQTFGRLVFAKTVVLGASIAVLALIAAATGKKSLFWEIGLWVALRTIVQSYSQLQLAILKSVSRAKVIGILQSVHGVLLLLGLGWAYKHSWSVFTLLAWLTCCQSFELVLGARVLYRNGIVPRWPECLHLLQTLKSSVPLGLGYGLANLSIRSDTIILSMVASLAAVGAFSAANAILLIVYLSSWLFSSVLLPEMLRIAHEPDGLTAFANEWARRVLLVSVPCVVVVCSLAPRAIVFLYGANYASSGLIASALLVACPFILLNAIYTARVIAIHRADIFVKVYGVAALATLALDFLLGHLFGSLGISVAIVIREAGILTGYRLVAYDRVLVAGGKTETASGGQWDTSVDPMRSSNY